MTEDHQTPRHMFQGPTWYRVMLLAVGLAIAILLLVGAVILPSTNWARQMCPLLGTLSGLLLAVLVGLDIFRPQTLTPARVRLAVRAFFGIACAAILLAVVGFLI